DLCIIAEVQRIITAIGRDEVYRQEDVGGLLFDVDALFLHAGGKLRHGQLHSGLHQHQGRVHIGTDLETDRQRVVAVVGAGGGHVNHALDAVDLLFDRLAHGVGQSLGTGTRVGGSYLNGRRHNGRVLGGRQRFEANQTGEHDHDGEDPGKVGTINKETRHGD